MNSPQVDVLPNGKPIRCACGKRLTRYERRNKICDFCLAAQTAIKILDRSRKQKPIS